jgi:hypothetical protein
MNFLSFRSKRESRGVSCRRNHTLRRKDHSVDPDDLVGLVGLAEYVRKKSHKKEEKQTGNVRI